MNGEKMVSERTAIQRERLAFMAGLSAATWTMRNAELDERQADRRYPMPDHPALSSSRPEGRASSEETTNG